ncbi:hypothetical protein CSEC_2205 [Criblamydia sequanensis CRIB-18]|uniref:Uncharacterized protein n=1 Tax=Candidatus Criblamydia sequanensis CRIB-18 TaxID=1437425 RepID=A0A090D0X6_9BACT|nr:hypothetical protein CSEC_2205 [Criblamydia sequanensis CRIB-18]
MSLEKASQSLKIEGFTQHGVNRAIQREINPQNILDTLKNPIKINDIKIDAYGRASQRFIGAKAEVVINPETRRIISVNATSSRKVDKLLNAGNK